MYVCIGKHIALTLNLPRTPIYGRERKVTLPPPGYPFFQGLPLQTLVGYPQRRQLLLGRAHSSHPLYRRGWPRTFVDIGGCGCLTVTAIGDASVGKDAIDWGYAAGREHYGPVTRGNRQCRMETT